MKTFSEKIAALCERRRFGMKPGLERMEALMGFMGHPERELAAVHVAGTNGKGSVTAIVASVLQEAGLGPVGRYTSPHLVFFNERIQIGGEPISDGALESAIDEVMAAIRGQPAADATFFEIATAAAFCAFRNAGVRVAVIETGLGGRLDATNVILPVVSAITNIGLEHCEWLGDTVEAIAAEKAGIVKPGRPVVMGAMPDAARAVIAARAAEVGAPLSPFSPIVSAHRGKDGSTLFSLEDEIRSISGIRLPLEGAFQSENLATAAAAVESFAAAAGIQIDDGPFKSGLADLRWPCRFQTVRKEPLTIVDGAHNPPAAAALAASLQKLGRRPLALVAGFCGDKDVAGFLRILHPRFRVAFATETPNSRTLPASGAAALMAQAGFDVLGAGPDLRTVLDMATDWASSAGGAIVVCGSLFLAGAAAETFGAFPWRRGARSAAETLHPPCSQPRPSARD